MLLLAWAVSLPAYSQSPDATPTPTPAPVVTPPSDPAKFELFLLVGQSNMAGRGKLEDEDRRADPRILTLDAADQWVCRGQPIHFDKPVAGAGLGFAFAKLAADKKPGVMIGLIPSAFGGTAIRSWQPGQKLYQDAVKRAKIAMKNGKLKAILWHQGESDSGREDPVYASQLKAVIDGFRKDLGAPSVPFIMGELGEFTFAKPDGKETFARSVNDQMKSVAAELPNVAVASSQGLTDRGDHLHFNSESLKEFGKRYFDAWQKMPPQ